MRPEDNKVFRVWLFSSLGFILVSLGLLSAVFVVQIRSAQRATLESYRRLVENKVEADVSAISDDVYLGLDTIGLRSESYSRLIGGRARIALSIRREAGRHKGSLESKSELVWQTDTDQGIDTLVAPLTFGAIKVGDLVVKLTWDKSALMLSRSQIAFQGIAPLVIIACFWLAAFSLVSKKIVDPLIKRNSDLTRDAAIAKTTQMLAHDVRRPFAMMRVILDSISDAESMPEVRGILASSSVDVRSALASVTGMLQDVMEVGGKTSLSVEPESPVSMVEATIREVCRIYPECSLEFEYSITHLRMVNIDTVKVQRVLSNIVGNAIQAMNKVGRIWFKTRDIGGMIEVCIGNSGSYIATDDLPHLFDAFFTSGKKGGTGLGLAIAKKIVEAHGGSIRCESSRDVGVEFLFTLPAADLADSCVQALPRTSEEVHEAFRSVIRRGVNDEGEGDAVIADLEGQILDQLGASRIRILVLDDEAVYRNAVGALLKSCERLDGRIEILSAKGCSEALALLDKMPAIGLIDYDLGPGALNGIETIRAIRGQFQDFRACLHTNRIDGGTYKEALDAGASHFLPKPITKEHLLRFIAENIHLDTANLGANTHSSDTISNREGDSSQQVLNIARTRVIVLDDDAFAHVAWKRALRGGPTVNSYKTPSLFLRDLTERPNLLDDVCCIVTDHNFEVDNPAGTNGIQIAIEIRKISDVPIFLSSSGIFSVNPSPAIDRVIPKEGKTWSELRELVDEVRVGSRA